MKQKNKKTNILILILIFILMISCQSTDMLNSETINKNITLDAKIASIDAYGNIKLNILAKAIVEANFNYNEQILLQFSNGYLIESNLTSTNNNISKGTCYTRTIGEDNPITIGIKDENLAKNGTLKIGDVVKIYQLSIN